MGVDGSPGSYAAVVRALEEARFRRVPPAVLVWALFDQYHNGPDHFDPRYNESAGEFLAEQVEKAVGLTSAAEIELVTECDLAAAGLVRAADAVEAPSSSGLAAWAASRASCSARSATRCCLPPHVPSWSSTTSQRDGPVRRRRRKPTIAPAWENPGDLTVLDSVERRPLESHYVGRIGLSVAAPR